MSAAIRFTESAKWQLHSALHAVDRVDPNLAKKLLESVRRVSQDAALLEEEGRPLPELPALLYREVRVGSHRVFFRHQGDEIWIAGIWKTDS